MEKEEFYGKLTDLLKIYGFVFDKTAMTWTREKEYTLPESTLILSGGVQETVPERQLVRKIVFAAEGEGSIDGKEFVQISYGLWKKSKEEEGWNNQKQDVRDVWNCIPFSEEGIKVFKVAFGFEKSQEN